MSKKTVNDLAKTYSGIFGHQVVIKNRGGKSVMTIPSLRPKVEPNESQLNVRRKFILASRYAKNILQDPDMLVVYTAKSRKGFTPYIMAMCDYLKPPVVDQIGLSGYHGNPGDKIGIAAFDDFGLTGVTVQIIDPTCNVIEQGACVFNLTTGNYDFTATVPVSDLTGVTIIAKARDYPGHTGELSVTL